MVGLFDSIMVGHYSTADLAAVSFSNAIFFTVMVFAMGALMGVTGAVETLLVAALLGILVMVPYGMLAAKKSAQNKNSEDAGQIPFGPFLAIAAPIIYLWGSTLVDIYFKYVLE